MRFKWKANEESTRKHQQQQVSPEAKYFSLNMVNAHLDSTLWTITLCLGLLFWFLQSLSTEINYDIHPQLVDPSTGKVNKPRDLLDLSKVINVTEAYINSTNAQERLFNLEYMMNFENPITVDHSYSSRLSLLESGLPVANEAKCGAELAWLLNKYDQNRNNYTLLPGRLGFELTSLMDSFGKPEAGAFGGVVNWMGSYRSCMKLSLNESRIRTRYCIGRMRFKSWPRNETIQPKTRIRFGLCIPETCSTISFEQHGASIERLAKMELSEQHSEQLQLDSMFCLPDERSPIRKLPLGGYLFLSLLGAWLALVLLASLAHECLIRMYPKRRLELRCSIEINNLSKEVECHMSENPVLREGEERKQSESEGKQFSFLRELLQSLSLRVTINEFKSNNFKQRLKNGPPVRLHLGLLDFLKVLCTIMVVFAHSSYLASIYSRNLSNRIEMSTGVSGKMIMTIGRVVDLFFLFFGLLTTYSLMKRFSLRQLANPLIWLLINFRILLRIMPIFVLTYWYARSVSPYTFAGPWWDYGVYDWSIRGQCMSDAWWKWVPYFGSSGGIVSIPACNLPSWFLISYSRISLLLPLLTYLLCTLPSFFLKSSLVLFMAIISSLNIGLKYYWQTSFREEAFTLYGAFLADLMEKFESLGHMDTLGRMGAVATGCLVGYYLRLYEQERILKWPRWLRSNLTLLAAILGQVLIFLAPVIGHQVYELTGKVTPIEQVVGFSILMMIIFPVLNAITIINATTVNNHSLLARFMSHSFWHIFNKLGLSIYLVHWELIFTGLTSYEQGPSHNFGTDFVKSFTFGLCGSFFVALLVHFLFESPLARLTALLFDRNLERIYSAPPSEPVDEFRKVPERSNV